MGKLLTISTAEAVVNHFKESLLSGQIHPGDQLPSERTLQEQLGVSRFSLREGLARLSALGIISISHGKGAFVESGVNPQSLENVLLPLLSSQHPQRLKELMDARALIEGEAAVLAAKNAPQADIDDLAGLVAAGRKALTQPQQFGELDFLFHQTIAHIGGNQFFLVMLGAIASSVQEFLNRLAVKPAARKQAQEDHEQILNGIQARSAANLRELTKNHINACLTNFETLTTQELP